MGRDDNTAMRGVTGGSAPAEFWRAYMRVALKHAPPTAIAPGPPEPPPPPPPAFPFGLPPAPPAGTNATAPAAPI
jgi:penicillin-binding protein 1A